MFPRQLPAVDRELPELIDARSPTRSSCSGWRRAAGKCGSKRCARNALSCSMPDAAGSTTGRRHDRGRSPVTLALPAPVDRLLMAARSRRRAGPRSRTTPAAISATTCAGGPREGGAHRTVRGLPRSSMCRRCDRLRPRPRTPLHVRRSRCGPVRRSSGPRLRPQRYGDNDIRINPAADAERSELHPGYS